MSSAAAQGLAVSADGALLAVLPESYRRTGTVRLWDLSSGRQLHQLKTKHEEPHGVAVTPDGKTVALASAAQPAGAATACVIQLWDTASGKELLAISPGERVSMPGGMAFSPDSVLLAATAFNRTAGLEVVLWNAATGVEFLRLPCGPAVGSNLAFSPDGRTLAAVSGTNQPEGNRLRVWEVASGTLRREFPANGTGNVLAFSPDGRTLAAGAADTTVTLWDVGGRLVGQAKEAPSAREMEELWAALDEPDAARAHRAMLRLAAVPKEAVAFLTTRLRPAEGKALDEEGIAA